MVKMRVPISTQLAALVVLASLIGLAVVGAAAWITNYNFVLDIRSSGLSLTASLKAAQISSSLYLMQRSVRSLSTRVLIQASLQRYNQGNDSTANWEASEQDLEIAINIGRGRPLMLQAVIVPQNDQGKAGGSRVMNATSSSIMGEIPLPYTDDNGKHVYLGDNGAGYPPELYPNLTFSGGGNTNSPITAAFDGETLDDMSTLLLGPLIANPTLTLLSMTVPIVNNTSASDVLGWLTVVFDARLVVGILSDDEGLGESGVTLLVGPTNATNRFSDPITYQRNGGSPPENADVRFLVPPNNTDGRHDQHSVANGKALLPFDYNVYPAVKDALTKRTGSMNNAGSLISTKNEQGASVAVGYAVPEIGFCDWAVIVEQSHSEVWHPIYHLRNILLGCIFGTLGFMFLLSLPVAHYSSSPIRRLREATRKSVRPAGMDESVESLGSSRSRSAEALEGGNMRSNGPGDTDLEEAREQEAIAKKEGFAHPINWVMGRRKKMRSNRSDEERRRQFRIPGKVQSRKHFVHDELTDLTETFNEMSDELMMQYERLEERVQQRTAELALSKEAAEAANESKTLFIANISHELKTPLNGILGMCAVCMSEDDPVKLKRSLGIIYRSGDLLLNLLTDLLTFTRNQVGQQITLDEKEFLIRDVSSQVMAIFDKQAKDSGINLNVSFEGPSDPEAAVGSEETAINKPADPGLYGSTRIRDMVMYGDQHRILQVLINLVSNSLKFTPSGGSVSLVIRCVGESKALRQRTSSQQNSILSRNSSANSRLNSGRGAAKAGGSRARSASRDSPSLSPSTKMDTANEINPMDRPSPVSNFLLGGERSPSPAPPPGVNLRFEFEVRDTGPGIPPHLQQRIFEPFVQGDLGLSKKFGGTGLGLSICSQLATLMRGAITLRSTEGVGSTFNMAIPLRLLHTRADSTASSSLHGSRRASLRSIDKVASASGPAASRLSDEKAQAGEANSDEIKATNSGPPFEVDNQPRLVGLSTPFFATNSQMDAQDHQIEVMERVAAEATEAGDKIKVLVAEDNKTNQEVVLRMLKLEDIYDVTLAKDGQEALDIVKESMANSRPFDLIFMDVQMPNLDGLQSTRAIREIGYQAPIVALTAYSEEKNIKDCMDSGMNYFLSKPIKRAAIKGVLKRYCPPIPEESEEQVKHAHSAVGAPNSNSLNSTTIHEDGTKVTQAEAQNQAPQEPAPPELPVQGVPFPDSLSRVTTGPPTRPPSSDMER